MICELDPGRNEIHATVLHNQDAKQNCNVFNYTYRGGETPTQWDYEYIYEKLKLFHRITIRDTDVNVLLHYWWYLEKKCLGKLFHKSN